MAGIVFPVIPMPSPTVGLGGFEHKMLQKSRNFCITLYQIYSKIGVKSSLCSFQYQEQGLRLYLGFPGNFSSHWCFLILLR